MTIAAVLGAGLAAAGAASLPAPAPIAWQWDGAPDLFPRVNLAAGKHAVALRKKKVMLRGPSWSVEVVGRRDQTSGAALATDGSRVLTGDDFDVIAKRLR